jgi:hypothetical protein
MTLCVASIIVLARPTPARSDTGTSPWGSPAAVATGLSDAASPSLATTSDGVEHAVWETGWQVFYAARTPGHSWSPARRIAKGISPVLVANDRGQLHTLFVNQFDANYEIYDSVLKNGAWSLPVNVSHTSGFSAFPAAAPGNAGALYVAWMDNSPGYWTIYLGTWNGKYWVNEPIANARGQAPTLSFARDGTLFLAWQDRVPSATNTTGAFAIFLSERANAIWTLPADVSDRPDVESIGASLTTTADGLAHLAWTDDGQEVRYCFGQGSYWPAPVTVVRAATLARGPRILTERNVRLHIAWDEGDIIRATSAAPTTLNWPKPQVITALNGDLRDIVLALKPGNGIALGWVQTHQPQDIGIYESWRASELPDRAWLPMMLR